MINFSMRADMRASINARRSLDMLRAIRAAYDADPIESEAIACACAAQWRGYPFMRHHRAGLMASIGSGGPLMLPIESAAIESDSSALNMLINFGALISWGEMP